MTRLEHFAKKLEGIFAYTPPELRHDKILTKLIRPLVAEIERLEKETK